MSDYGDDYSDYGEEWFFVEEEYMVADDLAEHAVQSPPPTAYDEDMLEEWDRYDYFNDLEYASDGYDNAKFEQHGKVQGAQSTSRKRKRGTTAARSRKKQGVVRGGPDAKAVEAMLTNSPVVWRSQADRDAKPKLLPKNVESYALLKDWRKTMADAPNWAKTFHSASPVPATSNIAAVDTSVASQPLSPTSEPLAEEDDGEEEELGIDPAALMAALQSRLATAGGPLSGMDPQQLLQFAMRMANNEGAGDDIAGEMADEMLNQGDDEEEDEEAEANLLSWVTQQRDTSKNAADSSETAPTQDSPDASRKGKRLPTPPSSERNRSVYTRDEAMDDADPTSKNATAFTENGSMIAGQTSRKRKADGATESGSSTNAPKRRATRSYEAPTAASQARTAPAKTTRSGRIKR